MATATPTSNYMQAAGSTASVTLVAGLSPECSRHATSRRSATKDRPRAAPVTRRHAIQSKADPQSSIHPSHLINTCGHCHEEPRRSCCSSDHKTAGEKNAEGTAGVLSCMACHTGDPHGMRPVDDMSSPVFVNHQVEQCGKCHEDALSRISGQRSWSWSPTIPGCSRLRVCADCHRAHGIWKADKAESTLYATRVAHTCGVCHRFIEDRLLKSVHGMRKRSRRGERRAGCRWLR